MKVTKVVKRNILSERSQTYLSFQQSIDTLYVRHLCCSQVARGLSGCAVLRPSAMSIVFIRNAQSAVHIASCSNVGARRIREVVPLLSQGQLRKQDVQASQSKWKVAEKRINSRHRQDMCSRSLRANQSKQRREIQQQLADREDLDGQPRFLKWISCFIVA